jgi:transcriptional regulator with PAS, ATPase and Fis domain
LRERPEDLIPLLYQFLGEFNGQYGLTKQFSQSAVGQLIAYRWPGNVRELRNVVERLIVTSASDLIDRVAVRDPFEAVPEESDPDLKFRERVARYESQLLREALLRFGSTRAVARELDISQSTVVRKLRPPGVDVDDLADDGDASLHRPVQQ